MRAQERHFSVNAIAASLDYKVPIVLRDQGDGIYRVISEYYLHGITEGEAMGRCGSLEWWTTINGADIAVQIRLSPCSIEITNTRDPSSAHLDRYWIIAALSIAGTKYGML
jgi:hypothetical protein